MASETVVKNLSGGGSQSTGFIVMDSTVNIVVAMIQRGYDVNVDVIKLVHDTVLECREREAMPKAQRGPVALGQAAK